MRFGSLAFWSTAILSTCWMKAVLPSPALPVSMTSFVLGSRMRGMRLRSNLIST